MNALVCPITLESIKDPVRTLAGIIYERFAILEWFENNAYDPVTRLVLPSKHLLDVNETNVHQSPQEFRTGLKWTICNPIYHMAMESERKFTLTNFNNLEYSAHRLQHLKENPLLFFMNPPKSDDIDVSLQITRAPNTGTHFQCLDLSGSIVTNLDLKLVDFRGSKFECVVFYRMTFSHCNFSHTDLTKTAFVECTFRGEQTIFIGAKTSPLTKFTRCEVESHKSWFMTEPEACSEELNARGLNI